MALAIASSRRRPRFSIHFNRALTPPRLFSPPLTGRYRFGRQVEQSTERANAWLTRAAQAGHADAQNHLARMIQQGPAPSQRDFERAAVLLQRAVDQNHVEAIFNLAACYETGCASH